MSSISCHVTSCTIMSHHVTLFVTCLVTLHTTSCRDVMSRYVTYFQATSCYAIRDISSHAITYHLCRGKRGMGRENWIIFPRPYPPGACVVAIVYHITTVKHNVSYSEWCILYESIWFVCIITDLIQLSLNLFYTTSVVQEYRSLK